ncbi:hypothetical protein QU617_16865 [Pseudomonas guariconensis]|uniref:hypothetical protein n=1 Tax=Pseudomonas guariconensis TaxID=1288410 RepID=UPI0025A98BDB|nr:hypothetical protein [Pseudomonas guariconensis]MDM9594979.1 hypothetical protein [Pseudomonas guariconensis]MDM9607810.1 hypothetical protein [Pseudomonas guariconensis]MDM9612767.1 hypothetical protein [Pseudomonas guariconensis]
MAVNFFTSNPKALLDKFNERIDQEDLKGKITTWVRDKDGDFTHVADDWKNKAWFRPKIIDGALVFNILGRQTVVMPTVVYGYYHGHLTETFLNHFDQMFSSSSSTALATKDDRLGGSSA